jgi:hypothetical protein
VSLAPTGFLNKISEHLPSAATRSMLAVCLVLAFAVSLPLSAQAPGGTEARRSRRPTHLPLTKFYDLSNVAKSARPGTLIRSEQTYDYALSADVVTRRILYYSRAPNGDPVAVSGVVMVPEKPTPPGGWPVIAWADGFEGVARQCARSLRDNLVEGPLLSMYLNLGYAVVVTDYAGLGTASRNAYIDMQSNATDVIYSVPAARAADPDLSPRWIAMGINEGNLVAAAVAEVEHDIGDSNYLGSVALSGIVDGTNLVDIRSETAQLPVFLAYGIKSIFPQFQPSEILTDKAMPLYREAETSCTLTNAAGMAANEALKPNWEQNESVRKFVERNTLGRKPAVRGLLVLASETDPNVPMSLTTQAVARLCKEGDHVQFFHYPNPDSRAVIGDSVRDQIDWIRARFANQTAPSNCH